MGSFSKMVIFLFCTVGLFALLFSLMPPQFFAFETTYSASIGIDKAIAQAFDVANVTVYTSLGSGNMTYQWSSYHDHPSAPQHQAGLPSGQYLEVWWADDPTWIPKSLQFRHTTEEWWGLAFSRMAIYYADGSPLQYPNFIYVEELENAWNNDVNASVFLTKTPVTASYLFQYNQSAYSSIVEAWDGGKLNYVLSYEPDWNASNVNAFGIMAQLLTFQNPDLGIEGDAGTIFNFIVAAPFWTMTAILILLVIQSLIPFIRGIDA